MGGREDGRERTTERERKREGGREREREGEIEICDRPGDHRPGHSSSALDLLMTSLVHFADDAVRR